MKTFLIILILMVSVPSVMAHPVIIGSSVNEIPHDHPPNEFENSELVCENPDSEGFCFKLLSQTENANITNTFEMVTGPTITQISDAGILLIVLVASITVTVLIIFGKDISRLIKKH